MYSKSIQNLIDSLAKLPSIGPRQASRIAFYLLKKPNDITNTLARNLLLLKKNVKLCQKCFLSYERENEKNQCDICLNTSRKQSQICIIQKEIEIKSIENIGVFLGMYHIVGEDIDILKKDEMPKSIEKLIDRIRNLKKDGIENIEIILATNPTTEGNALSLYLEKELKKLEIKITSLGRGLSSGDELEYADQSTLSHAFENRK
ncbi:MAG: recombination mediator RecR [Patescibacteria group bacterium]